MVGMGGTLFATEDAAPMETPVLRDYQSDVISRVRQRVRDGHQRIILQAMCGAGKTVMSSEIIRLAVEKRKTCLFLAHRRRLISQKSKTLQRFGIDHGLIMAGEDPCRHSLVQIASRDTLLSRSFRRTGTLPPADLVIVDEGHRVQPDRGGYRDILDAYPDAVIIMLTATPVWPDGTGMGRYFTALECAVPPSQLIKEGHLVPIRCYAPKMESSGKSLVGDPVLHWKKYAENSPTILFAGKVDESKAVVDAFLAAGIAAEHIDARTPDVDRERILARVESGQTRVLSNVGVAIEGFDLPCLRCVQIFRSASSYILFVQACGRVMRPYPGKKDAILIDHAAAILKHGFPDDDVEWSLDVNETIAQRKKKARQEGKIATPIICPSCALMFTNSPICPGCGRVMATRERRKAVQTQKELLVQHTRPATAEDAVAAMEARLSRAARDWVKYARIALHMGRAIGAAAHMFKKSHGCWPDAFAGLERKLAGGKWALPRGNEWRMAALDLYGNSL